MREITVVYTTEYGRGRITGKLDEIFPRAKCWLTEFLRTVALDYDHEKELLDTMIDYLENERLPGLPEEWETIDASIRDAHIFRLCYATSSMERLALEHKERVLRRRKKHWDLYEKSLRDNLEQVKAWRAKAYGNLH